MATTDTADYFHHVRKEILPHLPPFAARVLEVGCGAGSTLAWLKAEGRCEHCCGVEYVASAAAEASKVVDEVFCGDAEQLDLGERKYDLVLLLDVLEHLVDPWKFLQRLQEKHLNPGAKLIASIPNVRNYRVVKALLFKGEFRYQDAGILDRTHLRFFTRKSACELMQTGKLSLEQVTDLTISKRSYLRLDRLSNGLFHDFLVYQFLISSHFGAPSQER